ncbi:MAG: 5-bromo-4-chloroindolyl phosphate hydrolysis family protein [Alphaproteobacteria bacterium]
MKQSGFPFWIFVAIFAIIAIPKLAGMLPLIFFMWFTFRVLSPAKSSRRQPSRRYPTRENPYRKQYDSRYEDKRGHSEPQTYQPKNYRYDDDIQPAAPSDADLANPWKKPGASTQKTQEQAQEKTKKQEYKPAPLKESEKQNFLVYFIPILVGALATSIAMQMGLNNIYASALGIILTLGLLGLLYLLRGKKVKQTLDANAQLIADGKQKVAKINELAQSLDNNPSIQWEIQEIARTVSDLYDNFIEDPSDIDRARNFIKYNLPDAIKLMETYVKVSNNPNIQTQANYDQLKKAEDSIISIRESFQKLQQDLLANDLMDLEVQSRSIKSVLQSHMAFMEQDKA